LCGHRIGSRLSTLTVSVVGLYAPPGEILVGGSDEFGKTQMVPVFDCTLDADSLLWDAVCPIRATDSPRMSVVRTGVMHATIVHCTVGVKADVPPYCEPA
jgi:hypothetical protein